MGVRLTRLLSHSFTNLNLVFLFVGTALPIASVAEAEAEAIEGGAIAVVIIIALLAVATVFFAETKGAANETNEVCTCPGANPCSY